MRKFCLLLCVILIAAGCKRGSGPVAVHPVQGSVIYDDEPAEGVKVYFFPLDDAPQIPAIPSNPRGLTGADGRFSLTTFVDGDGAGEGEYLVILHWPEKSDPRDEGTKDRLLGWYDAAHTSLRVRVKAGDNALPPFPIARVSEPPPKSEGIPGRN